MRVDLFGNIGSDVRMRNRIFFSYTGAGPTVTDLNTLTTTIGNAWNTNLAPLMGPIAGLNNVQITDLTSATAAQTIQAQSHQGTRTGANMSAAICVIIKFKIARRYRGGHPRYYQPGGVATDLVTPQQWNSTFIAAVQSAFAAFIAASILSPPTNIGTMAHVNVSYFAGFTVVVPAGRRARNVPSPRPTPAVDAVVSYSVNPLLGSQRRRNLQSP